MDRFRAPSKADTMARCQSCDERMHYLALDDDGLCIDCQPEPVDVDETKQTIFSGDDSGKT
jgi:hypothetical protein